MSYEPTLVINAKDLRKYSNKINTSKYERLQPISDETEGVFNYFKEILKHKDVKFGKTFILVCTPEFTSFNELVRDQLDDWEVEYAEID